MKKDIYVITNLITSTQYVGQSKDAIKRFDAHLRATDGTLLHQAILTYGRENFDIEILEKQIENFNEREQFWIEKLNTLYPNGYNMTKGGEGYPHMNGELCYQAKLTSEEVKEIIDLLKNTNLIQQIIADKFNVTQEIISSINVGKTYFNKNENYPIRKNQEMYNRANKIKNLLRTTQMTLSQIANECGVSKAVVNSINQGRTFKENMQYPIRIGKKGKLDDEAILLEIKDKLQNSKFTTQEIAEQYGVLRQAIEWINQGKSYIHSDWDYPLRKQPVKKVRFTDEELDRVIYLLQNTNMSIRAIGREMGVSQATITGINSGTTKSYYRSELNYPLRNQNFN